MIAYLDLISGISGDMFLSSLIDIGLPVSEIENIVSEFGIKIRTEKDKRHGISGTKIDIECKDQKEERSFKEIREMILKSSADKGLKKKAIEVFEIIARAEAEVHGCSIEEVHFHEIGGIDSIVDIFGVLYGIEYLGIEKVICSAVPLGTGTIRTSHGILPVPAPATLVILKDIPVYGTGINTELVTPTGAALIRYLSDGFGPPPPMRIKKIGYGIGKKEIRERPNLLRIILGDYGFLKDTDTVSILETNLDDAIPEYLGYLMEKLFEKGALDVAYVPGYMKKNRPGFLIKVISPPEKTEELTDILFKETGTAGIRHTFCFRKRLPRKIKKIETPWGIVKVKEIEEPDGSVSIRPEYEECLNIARKYDIPLRKVYEYIFSKNVKK